MHLEEQQHIHGREAGQQHIQMEEINTCREEPTENKVLDEINTQ